MAILWHYSGRGSAEGRVPGKGWERLSSDLGTPGVSRSISIKWIKKKSKTHEAETHAWRVKLISPCT